MTRITLITAGGQAVRPPLWARLVAVILGIALITVALLVAIPIVLVGCAIGLVLLAWFWIRSRWRRMRSPNGILDGRRGVRVLDPEGDPAQDVL